MRFLVFSLLLYARACLPACSIHRTHDLRREQE